MFWLFSDLAKQMEISEVDQLYDSLAISEDFFDIISVNSCREVREKTTII